LRLYLAAVRGRSGESRLAGLDFSVRCFGRNWLANTQLLEIELLIRKKALFSISLCEFPFFNVWVGDKMPYYKPKLMSKVSHIRQHHRHTVNVRSFNHRCVIHRTARLDNRTDARLTCNFDTIREWEVGIRG